MWLVGGSPAGQEGILPGVVDLEKGWEGVGVLPVLRRERVHPQVKKHLDDLCTVLYSNKVLFLI